MINLSSMKGLVLLHLNVRSLWSKKDTLCHYLVNSNIDILTISESWLHSNIPDALLNIPGYFLLRNDRDPLLFRSERAGGGVAMYIKHDLLIDNVKMKNFNRSTCDLETLWLSVKQKNNKEIFVCSVYRPPKGNPETFTDTLSADIEHLLSMAKGEVFVMGDININLLRTHENNSKNIKNAMLRLGMKQLIAGPTRMSNVSANSLLDVIFTNSSAIASSGTLDWNVSDHMGIFVHRKMLPFSSEKQSFLCRSYKKLNLDLFKQSLMEIDQHEILDINDPNEAWLKMKKIVEDLLDDSCPVKKMNIKKPKADWMNNEILDRIIYKDTLLKKAKKSNKPADWEQARKIRNEVNAQVRLAKAEFIKSNLQTHAGDHKKFWQDIKQIIPDSTHSSKISLTDEISGTLVNELETPNYINRYFVNISQKLAENLTGDWKPRTAPRIDTFSFTQLDLQNLIKIIKDIDINKSSAIPFLSSYILKVVFLTVPMWLLHIFNRSLLTNSFPHSWKKATVIPLPKGGARNDVSNLRPVSLLPLPGKLLEKCIHSQTLAYLDANNILIDKQGGFRPNKSTISTVFELNNIILNNNELNQTTLACFVDFSKAFDTINHLTFLQKIKHLGFDANVCEWFKNYLENRSQTVLVNNRLSDPMSITTGVPQGSIIGPLAFLLYINDISDVFEHCQVLLYADDTVLLNSNFDLGIASSELQRDLTSMNKWCAQNKLTINTRKTKVMCFGSKNQLKKIHKPDILLNGSRLSYVDSFKYLGITLDPQLNYDLYLSNVLQKVTYKSYILRKIRRFIDVGASLQIYKSMILPYIEYGDFLYHTASKKKLNKLQTIQNQNLKLCLNLNPRNNNTETHRLAGLNLLEDRRNTHLLNFMYKKSRDLNYIDGRIINTRKYDAPVVMVPPFTKVKSQLAARYRGASAWNDIEPELRSINTFKKFKEKQKRALKILILM